MSEQDIKKIVKTFAKIYAELKYTIEKSLPDPREEFLRYLYDLRQEPLSLEIMVEELKRQGLDDLVEKILEKPPRKMLGFLYWYGYEGETVYNAYKKLLKHQLRPEIRIEDFSTDVLTIADAIQEFDPEKVVVFTLKSRGREPGIYRYTKKIMKAEGLDAVERIRPSLEGLLDIDALVDGLGIFSHIEEIEIVECEPDKNNLELCTELLYEEALREINSV